MINCSFVTCRSLQEPAFEEFGPWSSKKGKIEEEEDNATLLSTAIIWKLAFPLLVPTLIEALLHKLLLQHLFHSCSRCRNFCTQWALHSSSLILILEVSQVR